MLEECFQFDSTKPRRFSSCILVSSCTSTENSLEVNTAYPVYKKVSLV